MSRTSAAVFASICLSTLPAGAQQFTIKPVVTSSSAIAGLPADARISEFERIKTAPGGVVYAMVTLEGGGLHPNLDDAMLLGQPETPCVLVAKNQTQAPGFPAGTNHTIIDLPSVRDDGTAIFQSIVHDPEVFHDRCNFIRDPSGAMTPVLCRGTPVDNLPGVTIRNLRIYTEFDEQGYIAMRAFFEGEGIDYTNDSGIILYGPDGSVECIAKGSDPAPDMPAGVEYRPTGLAPDYEGISNPRLTRGGVLNFYSVLYGTGVTRSNDDALFVKLPGEPVRGIARQGDQILGQPEGVVWDALSSRDPETYNENGSFGSIAMTGPDITPNEQYNLGKLSNTGQAEVAFRLRETLPGMPEGVVFQNLHELSYNNSEHVAMHLRVQGEGVTSSNDRLYMRLDETGQPQILAREASQAPGFPEGTLITSMNDTSHTIQLNELGIAVFSTEVSNPYSRVLYASYPDGRIIPIISKVNTLDVDPDPNVEDLRTVTPVMDQFHLNDDGTLAFLATYDFIYTGLFTVDLAAALCTADTNHDGMVTPADFTAWIAAFNAQAPECDQNDDGLCTPADFAAWIANYNAGC